MTDTTFNIITTNSDSGDVSLSLGAPVNQTFSGTVTNNQSTIVVPDTILLSTISADVVANVQVTVGALSAQSQTIIRNSISASSSGVATISVADTLTSGSIDLTLVWPAGTSSTRRADVYMDIGDGQGFKDLGAGINFPTTVGPQNVVVPQDGRQIRFRTYSWDTANGPLITLPNSFVPDITVDGVDEATVTVTANTVVLSGSIAGRIQDQWANPPAYINNLTRHIPVDSQSEFNSIVKQGSINGGDSIEIAYGLDLDQGAPDFLDVIATAANPLHIVGVGTGNKPIIRGAGNRLSDSASGAQGFRVFSFRGCDYLTLARLDIRDSDNTGIFVGARDETDPKASKNMDFFDVDISNIRNAAWKTIHGSNNVRAIGGRWKDVGRLPVSVAQSAGSGNGEPAYWGRGASGGHELRWAAYNSELINVHMSNCFGEVDLKRPSHSVDLTGCIIEDMDLHSQGAITVAINPRTEAEFRDYNANFNVRQCVVRRINSRRPDGGTNQFGACLAAGNVLMEDNIIDTPNGDCVHLYQDGVNSIHKTVTLRNNILIAKSGKKSVEPLGGRSDSNPTNVPLTLHCDGNIVNVPVSGAASNVNETVVSEANLHTVFAGSQADFANRNNLTAQQLVALYLPA